MCCSTLLGCPLNIGMFLQLVRLMAASSVLREDNSCSTHVIHTVLWPYIHTAPIAEVTSQLYCTDVALPLQDVDLAAFVQIVCNVLDIPVYDKPVEALHVLFTLLLEFKSNPAFKASQAGGLSPADQKAFSQPDSRSQSQAGLRSESRGTGSTSRQSADFLAVS